MWISIKTDTITVIKNFKFLYFNFKINLFCSSYYIFEMVETDIYIKWSSNIKAPLIILFGWAGCHDRYLSKYSNIYETKKF